MDGNIYVLNLIKLVKPVASMTLNTSKCIEANFRYNQHKNLKI